MEKLNKWNVVEIIKYGHWLLVHKSQIYLFPDYPVIKEIEEGFFIDTMPELVGQFAVVDYEDEGKYTLTGVNKHAWYDREQLEPVLNAKPE